MAQESHATQCMQVRRTHNNKVDECMRLRQVIMDGAASLNKTQGSMSLLKP